jgi:hypothetical protein
MPVGSPCGRARFLGWTPADVKISRARSIDALAALGVAVLTFAYRYLSFERFPNDHFVHLSRAQQVLMGALPVRDYSEYQAPLAVMASAWAQATFGPGLRSELLLVCAAFAVAAAMAYLVTASISGSVIFGIACALILTSATPVSYSYPKVLPYVIAFGAAWWYAQKPDLGRLWLLAATVVFAGLLRHDHAIVLGAGTAVAVFAAHRDTRRATTTVAQLALVGVVLAAPYILWVQRYEGIGNYIASNIDVGRIEAEKATWSAPRFELDRSRPLWIRMADPQEAIVYVRWQQNLSDDTRQRAEAEHGLRLMGGIENDAGQYAVDSVQPAALAGLVRDPAVRETAGIDPQSGRLEDRRPMSARVLQFLVLPGDGVRPAMVALLYYISWLLPLAATLLLALGWRDMPTPVRSITAMAIVVGLIMCREMLRDPLATRVRDVAAPLVLLLALLPVLARVRATTTSRLDWRRRLVIAAVFIVTGAASAGAGSFGANLRETGIPRGWTGIVERTAEIRTRYASPRERIGDNPSGMIEYVMACTAPSSRILAMTFVSQLFFYTNRGFAGGYDALQSRFYSSDRQATQILQRLSREDVPLVILDNESASSTMQTYPRVAAYVTQHYREVGRFDAGQAKAYIILAENGRTPVRSFGDGHLPCFAPPEQSHLSRMK